MNLLIEDFIGLQNKLYVIWWLENITLSKYRFDLIT